MFPIMDVRGKVIGFGGRVMGDGEPKYLNSPETMIFDKSRNLYGLNFARTTKKHQILLCEGYMDVIALHQAGFDNAVAALGTAFTPGHANLLKRYTKEVYLTFDSDGAGIRAAKRAIPILKEAGITAKVINMKPYKDPDEFIKALGAEEYEKRNRELRKVRRFLREKSQKTTFEINLQQTFDLFLEEAERVTEDVRSYGSLLDARECEESGSFCHGDYQHHNLLCQNTTSVINFEKCALDSQMRDLYLFLRKLLEKTNWSVPLARGLLDVYGLSLIHISEPTRH